MTRFVKVAGKDELADGRAKVVTVDGRSLALFRINGEFFALANNCIHRGGPLGEGEVNDHQVTCPWHGWKYDVRDGSFTVIPTLKVKTFPVKVEDGVVLVDVA